MSLPAPTKATLNAWLEVRGTAEGPLFTNFDRAGQGNGRLTGTAVYKLIRNIGQAVGATTRPHGLRHLAVTEAVRAAQKAGYGIEEVLDFSRHADLKTLMVYVDHDRNAQGRIAALIS